MVIPNKYDIRESGMPNWRAEVFCNGEKIQRVVGYDKELGIVTMARCDQDGRLVHDNGNLEYEDMHGDIHVVEIVNGNVYNP